MFATDLDDTLYREIDYVISGYRAIADELERAHIMRSSEVVEVLETAENTWHGRTIWLPESGRPIPIRNIHR